jgi:hypothetical protein
MNVNSVPITSWFSCGLVSIGTLQIIHWHSADQTLALCRSDIGTLQIRHWHSADQTCAFTCQPVASLLQAALLKVKAKWYKKSVDPDFDPAWLAGSEWLGNCMQQCLRSQSAVKPDLAAAMVASLIDGCRGWAAETISQPSRVTLGMGAGTASSIVSLPTMLLIITMCHVDASVPSAVT